MPWNGTQYRMVTFLTTQVYSKRGAGIRNLKQITMHAGGYLSSHGTKTDSRAHPFSYKRVPSANVNYNKILLYWCKVILLFLEKNSTEITLELQRSQCKLATRFTNNPICILMSRYMWHNCDLYTFFVIFFYLLFKPTNYKSHF